MKTDLSACIQAKIGLECHDMYWLSVVPATEYMMLYDYGCINNSALSIDHISIKFSYYY